MSVSLRDRKVTSYITEKSHILHYRKVPHLKVLHLSSMIIEKSNFLHLFICPNSYVTEKCHILYMYCRKIKYFTFQKVPYFSVTLFYLSYIIGKSHVTVTSDCACVTEEKSHILNYRNTIFYIKENSYILQLQISYTK